jgi:hypothetical protein
MAQTSFSVDSAVALPGQLADNGPHEVIEMVAAETIAPGRLVVYNASSGKCELPQSASLDLKLVLGVAMYEATNPQAVAGGFTYAAGDVVPILRKGRIYASFSGGTDTAYTFANVKHSSTTATDRGKFSASATSSSSWLGNQRDSRTSSSRRCRIRRSAKWN